MLHLEGSRERPRDDTFIGLHELEAVKDFGAEMGRRGVLRWWRKAMDFDTSDDRL